MTPHGSTFDLMQQQATVGVAPTEELLTIPEVGAALKVTRGTVYRYISHESLPTVLIGSSRRVRRTDLQSWIAARVSVAEQP